MTKKEIVKQISDQLKISQTVTKDVVQLTLDLIIDALIQEGRIELRKFGVFEVRKRKSRTARNPRTGAVVPVPAKNVVAFQPGKIMEDQVAECKKAIEPKQKSRRKPVAAAVPSSNGTLDSHIADSLEPVEMPLKPR